MPGSIRTILPQEAETINEYISQTFDKNQYLYYSVVINARGELLSACLPSNRTLCCIESRSALSFSISSLYELIRNGCKTILKNEKVFFLPIKENITLIGGVGFFSNDQILNHDAAALINIFLRSTDNFFS